MERIQITLSLRDAREGYARITDNPDLDAPTCEWTASNEWTSVGFEPQDEDDKELMDNTEDELRATLQGLEYEIETVSD